jgi:hypothetical protein
VREFGGWKRCICPRCNVGNVGVGQAAAEGWHRVLAVGHLLHDRGLIEAAVKVLLQILRMRSRSSSIRRDAHRLPARQCTSFASVFSGMITFMPPAWHAAQLAEKTPLPTPLLPASASDGEAAIAAARITGAAARAKRLASGASKAAARGKATRRMGVIIAAARRDESARRPISWDLLLYT